MAVVIGKWRWMFVKRMSKPRYLISIDLGTSQTLLAYFDLEQVDQGAQLFSIPQSIAPHQQQSLNYLPSLRYQLNTDDAACIDVDERASQDPLLKNAIFGPLAEQLGAQTEGHLIDSAKSWLSQQHVDPTQAILPWAAAPGVSKLSAVDASASYLRYVQLAWNAQHSQYLLENQTLVITLPASFDDIARLYTQQAAARAGLPNVQFLEEPQAAFYDWYARHQQDFTQTLNNIDLVLVCDIGGGTSDFSLIGVQAGENFQLQRIAVSPHLLLGGDNIDAALAQQMLHKIKQSGQLQKLSKSRLQQWRLACRRAKEQLLSDTSLSQVSITLLGSGTRLIGDSFTEVLTRAQLMALIADGFFPATSTIIDDQKTESAFSEMGLAYEKNPAITQHVQQFLTAHQVHADTRLAILCNGGVLSSEGVQQLLIDALQPQLQHAIVKLQNPHPQHAVALGGIHFLRAKLGELAAIRAPLPRNYFLKIAAEPQPLALCVLPKGSELNQLARVPAQVFTLRVGEAVRFDVLIDHGQQPIAIGTLQPLTPRNFQQLPPLQLPLSSQQRTRERQVYLQASANELGNLQLMCVTIDEPVEQWLLRFDLKSAAASAFTLPLAIQQIIAACFGQKTAADKPIKTLKKDLEKISGAKEQWPIEHLRALVDLLLVHIKARRRSAEHERAWWHWLGFALRPGFGFVDDEKRLQQVLALLPAGIQYQQDASVWREWWLAWRRISGGLSLSAQQAFYQQCFFERQAAKISDEQLQCLASFEYFSLTQKTQIAREIWQRLQQTPQVTALWWALGRVGFCVYARPPQPLPVELIQPWLENLLTRDWQQQPLIAFTAVQLMQDTVPDDLRQAIAEKLKSSKCPASWLQLLSAPELRDQQMDQKIWGDSLPLGIRLDR
jgi:molecular chaperone DnaK (HSP70)